MTTAARDRLARLLLGEASSSFSAELATRPEGLSLHVAGFGSVALPVTPAKARKLISLGEPARFGRGEQTLTNTDVRDTWEIPAHLVQAEWDDAVLADALTTVRQELGFPETARLSAQFHSLLVYEPGQFFLPHQDSEKSDDMVATLVVTLPSTCRGGELVVGHNGEQRSYLGSKTAISLVAFYADCRHEVLPVTSGYRVTLTYNLMVHGDPSRQPGDEGTTAELAALLREHFSMPAARYYGDLPGKPPGRLAYLLDHEYTARALAWPRLKGDDASRASLLRAAADRAGSEAVLALADVKETHDAYPAAELYGDGGQARYDRYDDYGGDEDEHEEEHGGASAEDEEYVTRGLVDSEITLTHWTRPDGARLEEISLFLRQTEVCTSTPSGALTPYSQEYEGYMGNWGNTLDRWYHRAAVVIWPRDQAFANRAETSPAWALDELTTMASSGKQGDARAAAATLAPFWGSAVRTQAAYQNHDGRPASLLSKALRAAQLVADASTAAMLLSPFSIHDLAVTHAKPLAKTAERYGQQWTTQLLRAWSGGEQRGWAHLGDGDLRWWAADRLPGVCARLHADCGAGKATAERLLELAWEQIATDIGAVLTSSPPSYRDRQLGELGRPLAAVLAAAIAIRAAGTRKAVIAYLQHQADVVTTLEMSAMRAAAADYRPPGDSDLDDMAADCAERLRTRLARPRRQPGDWSIVVPSSGCLCELCSALRAFLTDQNQRTWQWPLAQKCRQHVHSQIDRAELPVTHLTRRQGRPYTLILTKTEDLLSREQEARARDEADLEWLTDLAATTRQQHNTPTATQPENPIRYTL